jgi:hypothetical protein
VDKIELQKLEGKNPFKDATTCYIPKGIFKRLTDTVATDVSSLRD